MCIITMTALGTALGMSAAAISSATAASAAGVSLLGVATGVANAALAVGVVGGIAGGAIGAVSNYTQGKQQQAYYNYQAQVAQENAKIAEQNAAQERQSGIEEARMQRIKTLQAIGSQQTAMAANGMDVTSGTSLDIIEDTSAMGELDALSIQYNAEKKALAYEQQANNFQNQSNLDVISGKNAYSAGVMNAASSGLNGLGKLTGVAKKWSGFGS